jgi:hypothetical protein
MTGLTQDMHDPSVLLDFRDILLSSGITGDDGPLSINPAYTSTSTFIPPMSSTLINQLISVQNTLSLIADAIKRIHKDSVSHIFKENKSLYSSMPILDQVSPYAKSTTPPFSHPPLSATSLSTPLVTTLPL